MLHQLDDIEADGIGNGEQLDKVDAPLAGFGLCDPRLIETKAMGKGALIEISRHSFLGQEFYQFAVQFGVDRPHSVMVNSTARYSKRGSGLEWHRNPPARRSKAKQPDEHNR